MDIELTPEEQAKLDACVNPDADAPAKYRFTPAQQHAICAMMLKDDDCLEKASRLVKPTFFSQVGDEYLSTILIEFYKRYRGRPNLDAVREEFRKRYNPKNEDPKRLSFEAHLHTVHVACDVAAYERQYLLDQIEAFARYQYTRLHCGKLTHAANEDSNDWWNKVIQIANQWLPPSQTGPTSPVATWAEVCEAADAQREDWLIPNWAEYGCLTLFSSLPKLGKSTIVAELIASAMLGRSFYGLSLNPAPVLLVDPENRERTTRRRIDHALQGEDVGKLCEWFFRMNAFAKPLDLGLLRKAIQAVKDSTGETRLVVVLDTLRSCYSGAIENENDNSEMAKVIVPLKDLAEETNCALFLIHHNAKGADSYAGGTAILGSVDYYWNWRNDRVKGHGQLSCWGRGDYTEPLELVFDTETQTNRVYASAGPKPAARDVDLVAVPADEPGVTREWLAEAWGCSGTTAHGRLRKFLDSGEVVELKPKNRKYGKTTYVRAAVSCSSGGEAVLAA